MNNFDLIVIGAGPAGIMAAITAARRGNKVLLLEKRHKPAAKLMATGGGRCNLSNTLSTEAFVTRYGRDGKFMLPALKAFDRAALMAFFAEAGVECHAPDGFRVFPVGHNSLTVVSALEKELNRSGAAVQCTQRVMALSHENGAITGVTTDKQTFECHKLLISTGGKGYPTLGGSCDGYSLAADAGHKVSPLYPAMLPLHTKETWVKNCRADTVPRVELRINLPEAKKLHACGDLIFTGNGIAGPVVLDFSREITPLLDKHGQVPLLAKLTRGMNEEQLVNHLKSVISQNKTSELLPLLATILPAPLAMEICRLAGVNAAARFNQLPGESREKLIKLLAWTPLTVTGHEGFAAAMVTRGGVRLKEINPETLESRIMKGLHFAGEVVDLDGPCGGFNLQWCFSSGFLAGLCCNR